MSTFAAFARFLVLASMVLLGGTVALYWLVLRRPDPADPQAGALTRAARLSSALLLCGLLLNLLAQFLGFRDARSPVMSELELLLSTGWGGVWRVQIVLALVALIASILMRRSPSPTPIPSPYRKGSAWVVLTLCAVALCASPSFSSHAMATERYQVLAVAADVVHILAGSAWIGGLVLLASLMRVHRGGNSEPGNGHALALIRRFSPIALTAAGVIVLTGALGGFLRLAAWQELWTSTYGRLLSLKVALFFGVAAAGFYNWRYATPRLASSNDPEVMRRSMRTEIGLALALLVVTAFLIATSPPEH